MLPRLFLSILLPGLVWLRPTHVFQSGWNTAPIRMQIPLGISESLWRRRVPKDNPLSAKKVALGQALYFDKRLSVDGTVSCATCHDPAFAFTDSKAVAVGGRGTRGTRNAPTILNAAFNDTLFWDGRVRSLEDQVKHPLLSSFEMGMTSEKELITRLSSIPDYQSQFKRVFNSEGLTMQTIAKAIAAYERTLLSGNSPSIDLLPGKRLRSQMGRNVDGSFSKAKPSASSVILTRRKVLSSRISNFTIPAWRWRAFR